MFVQPGIPSTKLPAVAPHNLQAGLSHALSLRILHCFPAGLSHALSAPSAMLKASLQDGTPPAILEEQPLLAADSCDSQGFPARLQSSSDHSAHSASSCGGTSSSSAPAVQVPAHLPSAPCMLSNHARTLSMLL